MSLVVALAAAATRLAMTVVLLTLKVVRFSPLSMMPFWLTSSKISTVAPGLAMPRKVKRVLLVMPSLLTGPVSSVASSQKCVRW